MSGVLFLALNFMFDFFNISSNFGYEIFSLFRSANSFLFDDGDNIKRTLFVFWVIILLVGLKGDWMKKKLAWVKVKLFSSPPT